MGTGPRASVRVGFWARVLTAEFRTHGNAEHAQCERGLSTLELLSADSGLQLMNGFNGDNGSHISNGWSETGTRGKMGSE